MNMTRRINAAGLALVKQWEGLKTRAYQDVADVWTIGYGHTSAAGAPVAKPGMVTEARAEEILRADLAMFEERVARLVKVPLTDNHHAVLVSFDFNTGRLGKSTLLKKLNADDYDAVPAELMKWVNAGGKRVKGLVNRRSAEAGLWTKEAGIISTLGFAFTGDGPLRWALAGIIVASFAGGAFLFIHRRSSAACFCSPPHSDHP